MRKLLFALLSFSFLSLWLLSSSAAPPSDEKPYNPSIAGPSKEGEASLKRMRIPQGLEASLFAAEPLLANPVAFSFDEKGRCYVAETFRLHHGVTDNRSHMYWLDEDLACKTVEDRVAMYKKHLKAKFPTYEADEDRVRMVEDTRGEGRADRSTVFAGGFKTAATGIGA